MCLQGPHGEKRWEDSNSPEIFTLHWATLQHDNSLIPSGSVSCIYNILGTLLGAAAAKSLSRVWLCAAPIDGSPPGSDIPGILQARTLEQSAIAFFYQVPEYF